MTPLIIFSFFSGLITILSPCIWPILPIVFSFSVSHPGKSRPLGITLGIIVSFTILTLTLSLLVRSLGINPNLFRYLAVIVIIFFGLSLIYPKLGSLVESKISRWLNFTTKFKSPSASTFLSGFITGLSLGALWTPCAGPILATVAALSASGQITFTSFTITLAYVAGVAIPLFIFSLFGQQLFSRLHFVSALTSKIQKIFGGVMIITAILILFNLDTLIQTSLLDRFPFLNTSLIGSTPLLDSSTPAPEFATGNHWLNSPPLTLTTLKGKVILVDFWTYTCINCLRTLPHLVSWYDKYKDKGLVIIGVHTPEFEFEKDVNNVTRAIANFGIKYPVVQDNDYLIWNSYQNQYWPAEYLIDQQGIIRHTHFGEGEYDTTESAIQQLLNINQPLDSKPDTAPQTEISPETYLGQHRSQYYYPTGNLPLEQTNFKLSSSIPLHSFSLGGQWQITADNAIAGPNAILNYHFLASKVYLVLRPAANSPSLVNVYIDNKLSSQINVDSDRLYTLFDQIGPPSEHTLKLDFLTPGTQVFAFTFG